MSSTESGYSNYSNCLVLTDNIDGVSMPEICRNSENQWDAVLLGYQMYRKDEGAAYFK